jgi:hypothetical protein
MVFGTLDLVTIVENTSFTNLLEHLPPQLEIAGDKGIVNRAR